MNAHDMSDKIRGIVERDGYVPVQEVRYEQHPMTRECVGVFVVQDEDTGKQFTVTITEG